jgi:hypothetical protein
MLNLSIAMFKPLLFLSLLFFAQTTEPVILSPLAGDTLRGRIQIIGNLNLPNFASAELAFSYASDPNSWFPIQSFSQPPVDQNLVLWDTTLVTDGDYVLHLRVFFQDGTSQDIIVSDLKIRNDEISATETPTPAQSESSLPITATLPALETPTPTPIFPTPTALPPNPAIVTPSSIISYFSKGGLIAVVAILLLSLIIRSRRN